MMGSGKSTVGKRLANKLNVQFYDSDKIIEDREGLSVLDIHDFRGEEYFRQQEIKVISEVLQYGNVVLSTGGSGFLIEEVRELIKSRAYSIWLKLDADAIFKRVSRRNTRPLLTSSTRLEQVENMLKEREPFYSQADFSVESDDYVVDTILIKLKNFIQSNK
jgi:shikimate kinase